MDLDVWCCEFIISKCSNGWASFCQVSALLQVLADLLQRRHHKFELKAKATKSSEKEGEEIE